MDKTFCTIRTIAAKLGVSEKTIYRMLTDNQIPFAVKIGGQWRFRVDAIDSWIIGQTNRNQASRKTDTTISVHEALQQGTILYRIHGGNRDEIIDELLAAIPYSSALDGQTTKVSILSRESVASSSIDGIAYMMTDPALPVFFEKTMVLLAYLEKPVDFKALDGRTTEALFLVLPGNTIEQEIIDRKLRRLSVDPTFIHGIRKQMTRKMILEFLVEQEAKLFRRNNKP